MNVENHIAILSAMPEEVGSIMKNLNDIRILEYGDLTINSGFWIDKYTQKKIYYNPWVDGESISSSSNY